MIGNGKGPLRGPTTALRQGLRPAHWLGLPRLAWQAARWRTLRGGWFGDYLRRHRGFDWTQVKGDRVDIIVIIVDHFEPASTAGPEAASESVNEWCRDYAAIARNHRDADGRMPQHTWFYRAEYPNPGCLQALAQAAFQGFGEIEFHLHHGHDTRESFSRKLVEGLEFFNQFGAMLTAERAPERRFAYIAGNWALDNGAGDDAVSGCNTELAALREAGCYADFTFPALGSYAQPRTTNAIYYATDDPNPKSYDLGVPARVNGQATGDLLIFQGPSVIDWRRGCFEGGALEDFSPPVPDRLDAWLDAHIHVQGRPEWVFVKLHTHGMQSRRRFLSADLSALFEAMTTRWNRPPFHLHFATAREAYNMVRAAQAGRTGNPGDYRDYEVGQPANRIVCGSVPWRLKRCDEDRLAMDVLESAISSFQFADPQLPRIEGKLRAIEVEFAREQSVTIAVTAQAPVNLSGDWVLERRDPRDGLTCWHYRGANAIGGTKPSP